MGEETVVSRAMQGHLVPWHCLQGEGRSLQTSNELLEHISVHEKGHSTLTAGKLRSDSVLGVAAT